MIRQSYFRDVKNFDFKKLWANCVEFWLDAAENFGKDREVFFSFSNCMKKQPNSYWWLLLTDIPPIAVYRRGTNKHLCWCWGFQRGGRCNTCTYSVFYGLLLADRLKLSNKRLERTYTYHTYYTSPCLKPSALDITPNHFTLDFSRRCFNELNLLCQQMLN